MDSQNVLKSEHLWRFKGVDKATVQWEYQYYVLYDSSGRNAARLDWYASEKEWKEMTKIRSGIFLEEVERVKRIENTSKSREEYGCSENMIKTLFAIHSNWNPNVIILRSETESATTDWISALERLQGVERSKSLEQRSTIVNRNTVGSDPLYDPQIAVATFDVEMEDTAAAVRCELYNKYRLVLTNQHITLLDPESGNPVLSWLYRYVRRYGVNASSFLLEGGRQAAPGNGLFIFKNCNGHLIREIMEAKMRAFSRRGMDDDEYSYAVVERPHSADVTSQSYVKCFSNKAEEEVEDSPKNPAPTGGAKNPPTGGAKNSPIGGAGVSNANGINTAQYCNQRSAVDVPKYSAYEAPAGDSDDEPRCESLPGVHSGKPSKNSAKNHDERCNSVGNKPPKVLNKTKKPAVSEKPSKAKGGTKESGAKNTLNRNNDDRTRSDNSAGEYCDVDEIDTLPKTPRMSEVLQQLATHNLRPTTGGDDDLYGYSELDIKQEGSRERAGKDEVEGHLYGEKLVQQIRKEEESPYEELSMGK